MNKFVFYVLGLPLVLVSAAACSSNKKETKPIEEVRVPASEVAVRIMFNKAFELLSLVNKVDAVNFVTTECSNGRCFEEGSITVLCITANNGNPHSRASRHDARNSCDVKANKMNGNKTKLTGIKASDLANLVVSANGMGRKEDATHTCDPANCLTKGSLHIACKYPDKVNAEKETICNVTSGPMPKPIE